MAHDELDENEVQIGKNKIGVNTIIKFNLKTAAWMGAILYALLGFLYIDLRQEIKDSVQISTEEKNEFKRDVEKEWDSKLDKIEEITTQIRVDQARMDGNIKVILDRQQRNNVETVNPNVSVTPVMPGAIQADSTVN